MEVLVLNGSPHGLKGVTAQYIEFLKIKFSQYSFNTLEVAKKINKLENNVDYFHQVLQDIKNAEAIIWAFPVYTMLVPAQLKLFIELLFKRADTKIFQGKITTSISSSANFYDHTAHSYIEGISSDLGLKYVRGYSAEMREILSQNGRDNFFGFANDFFWRVAIDDNLEDKSIPKLINTSADLQDIVLPNKVEKTNDKTIVIVSDANPDDYNLLKMLEFFDRIVPYKVEYVKLNEIKIKGGCIGCLKCGDGSSCFYKDEYAEAFAKVRHADIVLYAGAIKDRFYSARFKKFIDRYFSNGHRHVLKAGLLGHIVSGALNQLPLMREGLEAHIEVAHTQRLGIISDDNSVAEDTLKQIQNMVLYLKHWTKSSQWKTPQTFLGVGGGKIFRDLVYFNRAVMGADYRFYKQNKLFDFPTRNYMQNFISRILMILQIFPAMKKDIKKNMNKYRVKPYEKMIEKERNNETNNTR